MKKVYIILLFGLFGCSFEGKALSFKRQVLPVSILIVLPTLERFFSAAHDCNHLINFEKSGNNMAITWHASIKSFRDWFVELYFPCCI